ncbi:unnamed protein product, partial [Iphiclides podalirius]
MGDLAVPGRGEKKNQHSRLSTASVTYIVSQAGAPPLGQWRRFPPHDIYLNRRPCGSKFKRTLYGTHGRLRSDRLANNAPTRRQYERAKVFCVQRSRPVNNVSRAILDGTAASWPRGRGRRGQLATTALATRPTRLRFLFRP